MALTSFIELRKSSARGSESVVADIMRHLHTRQHLGRAVVVHQQAQTLVSPARKQWLKLARSLQKQRASTLNADKILKYTHGITRMQRMIFSSKTPLERPTADIYFLTPDELGMMPMECWSVYVLCSLETRAARDMLQQLPEQSLVVDYSHAALWKQLGLLPKKQLETEVTDQWRRVDKFLRDHSISIGQLVDGGIHNVEAMDDALDTLLGGHSRAFLGVAGEFQRALELARPLRLVKKQRTLYDSLILLAHRVQALTPGAFATQFLEVYNEDDTFFLYDPARAFTHRSSETVSEAYERHAKAGRHNLARSLQVLASTTPSRAVSRA